MKVIKYFLPPLDNGYIRPHMSKCTSSHSFFSVNFLSEIETGVVY